MTECTHCSGQAQLFLCPPCISELRDMLIGLAMGQRLPNGQHAAGWLEHLADSALGRTKLGSSERRTPRYRQPLDGESLLASQIELLPGERWETVEGPASVGDSWPLKIPSEDEIDLGRARHDRERMALQHALGAARINLRASELLEYAHSVLVEWIRDICETRGAQTPAITTTGGLALWLARNVSAIASDEGASVCYREIKQIVIDIDHAINRPASQRYCGPCPNVGPDRDSPCNIGLFAKLDVIEVVCWKCKTAHNINDLIQLRLGAVDELLYSARDILLTMAQVGQPIPDRTWRYWRAEKKLVVRGWRGGEPMYWISDVRDLIAQKPQKAETGSAAKKRAG